jgi:hypothetical protein
MKTLFESILSSTNSGKANYMKTLLDTPDNTEALNNEWKALDLGLDLGVGEGYWRYLKEVKSYFYIVTVELKRHDIQTVNAALHSAMNVYAADICIAIREDIHKRKEMKKWAEKIQRTLHMTLTQDKNFYYLNFVK